MAKVSIATNGAAIRRARLLAGYGTGELARIVGISGSYLSNLEHGRRQPSPSVLRRIAAATGKTIPDLVTPEFLAAA